MNLDTMEGKWHQFKGRLRTQWGDISDDDIEKSGGSTERLLGILQEKYGVSRDKAKAELEELSANL